MGILSDLTDAAVLGIKIGAFLLIAIILISVGIHIWQTGAVQNSAEVIVEAGVNVAEQSPEIIESMNLWCDYQEIITTNILPMEGEICRRWQGIIKWHTKWRCLQESAKGKRFSQKTNR